MRATFVHPTAIIEDAVEVGRGTQIWDNTHLRGSAVVGSGCIIGGKTYIADDVRIGDRCKVNAGAYLCSGVRLGDGVMIAAHATFTNDIYPRACVNDLSELRTSEVDEHTTRTTVEDGVTVGANATVGSDLVLGRFAMIGMGAVVTHSVPPYTLVLGTPARPAALVCRCGRPLLSLLEGAAADGAYPCRACDLVYGVAGGRVVLDPLDQHPHPLAKAG